MKILKTSIDYECPILKVEKREVEFEGGAIQTHWVVVRQPLVLIIALTDDKKILLNEEARGKDNHIEWGIPCGKISSFNPSIEDLIKQALIELEEETGYTAHNIQLFRRNEEIRNWLEREYVFFIAWGLEKIDVKPEAGEVIVKHEVTFAELSKLIEQGEIFSGFELDALIAAQDYFKKVKLI